MPQRVLGLLPTHFPKPDVLSATRGTAECSATMCTFTGYGDDSPTSGFTLDGTIKVTGETYVYDLVYDVNSAGTKLRWQIDSNLTATATSLDGNLHNTAETVGEGFAVNWDVNVDFNDVVLDGARCPTAGSIHGETEYTVSAAGTSGQGYSAQGTVTFGPACGDAK